MRFALMRHASAAPAASTRDHDRPLTPSGHEEATAAAAWLAQHAPPKRIVASPSLRTQETARIVAAHLDVGVDTDPRIYDASPGTVLEVLAQGGDMVLVGHNPALETLVEHLLPPGQVPWRHMPPASVALLSGHLRRAGCTLEASWRPDL